MVETAEIESASKISLILVIHKFIQFIPSKLTKVDGFIHIAYRPVAMGGLIFTTALLF